MNSKILAAMIVVLASSYAQAEEASVPNLYSRLDELRSHNAILAEELKNKELQGKIDAITESTNPKGSEPAFGGQSFGKASPLVQTVSGTGGRLSALIILPDGGRMTARVGTRIPGAGVVRSITAHEILVTGKDGTLSLPFDSESTSTDNQSRQPIQTSTPFSPVIGGR